MAPHTKLETQILGELEYSDLSLDALDKQLKRCGTPTGRRLISRALKELESKKLAVEVKNDKTGEMLWRKL